MQSHQNFKKLPAGNLKAKIVYSHMLFFVALNLLSTCFSANKLLEFILLFCNKYFTLFCHNKGVKFSLNTKPEQ